MIDVDPQLDPPLADRPLGVAAAPGGAPALPPQAAPYLWQLRRGLQLYRTQARADELDRAFAAAAAVVAAVSGPRPHGVRPDLEEMRSLAAALPEFDELLSVAADEAEHVATAARAQLWTELGLASAPPRWTPGEREAARMAFACAIALAEHGDPSRLRRGLRALAAPRIAERLTTELAAGEEPWVRALGERYDSVRHRCAPRTTWRSRGLSELLAGDERSRAAVTRRLERWLANGGVLVELGPELEAALVHARTPPKFA